MILILLLILLVLLMIDYKLSEIGILDDLDKMRSSVDFVYPSYHYRFYFQNCFLFIARCKDDSFRLLSNFYPKKSLYTYNGVSFNIHRYRNKYWCLCSSVELFDVKRGFIVYVDNIIHEAIDSMFSFQPVLEF